MRTRTKKRPPTLEELVSRAAHSEIASIGSVVNKIVQIVRNPNSNANELKKIIEIDPPLSAKILRRANSAFYGIKRSVSSIQEAIVFIGFNTVREIAMSLKVGKLFEGGEEEGSYSRKKLWKHSLAVAMCCKALYRREFKMPGDDIYSTALLHDIGIMVEDQFAHELLIEAIGAVTEGSKGLCQTERELFGFDHSELGQSLIASWNIPEELTKAVGLHHRPLASDPKHLRATASIFVSDFACRDAGLSAGESSGSSEELDFFARSLESLKVSRESIEIILEDVSEELDRLEKAGELYQ